MPDERGNRLGLELGSGMAEIQEIALMGQHRLGGTREVMAS